MSALPPTPGKLKLKPKTCYAILSPPPVPSYRSMTLSSTVSWKTSTSVVPNLRALTLFSKSTSSSAKVRPRGSGRRKYV